MARTQPTTNAKSRARSRNAGAAGVALQASPASPASVATRASDDPRDVAAAPAPYLPAAARDETDFPGIVRQGQQGMPVRRVQEWLTYHGLPLSIDGAFGPATAATVGAFQARRGLAVTREVEAATWSAMVDPLLQVLAARASPADPFDVGALAIAQAHLAWHPVELGGDNRGPWVRLYTGGHDGLSWRWCAAFVTFILQQTSATAGQPMPVSGSVSCDALAYQARAQGRFVAGADVDAGRARWSDLGACSVFLVRHTDTDWMHTGFAFDGAAELFHTIEGNTNDDGSANGFEVCQRLRSVAGKDFVRLG